MAHAIYQEGVAANLPDKKALGIARLYIPGHTGHDFTDEEIRTGVCQCPMCSKPYG